MNVPALFNALFSVFKGAQLVALHQRAVDVFQREQLFFAHPRKTGIGGLIFHALAVAFAGLAHAHNFVQIGEFSYCFKGKSAVVMGNAKMDNTKLSHGSHTLFGFFRT